MNTTEIAKVHQPVELENGNTVCSCGFGNDPRFVPYFGTFATTGAMVAKATPFRQAQSRADQFLHLRGVAQMAR